jgi:hypothetical protein
MPDYDPGRLERLTARISGVTAEIAEDEVFGEVSSCALCALPGNFPRHKAHVGRGFSPDSCVDLAVGAEAPTHVGLGRRLDAGSVPRSR